jgi:hypothetical protein
MPAIHSAISYSPDMHFPARHLFQRITAITTCLLLLLNVSASAASASASASAAVHRRLFSITRSKIDQNSSEVFGGHSYSPGNSLSILWIHFSC